MLGWKALGTRAGKTALIWTLSLIAAIVCFGFLKSSGVVNNGVVELGGGFAGFIVSLFALNKIWGQEQDLEAQAAKAGSDFTYQEVVKALDLRHASPALATQLAPLTDYYRVKRLGDAGTLQMHYGTTSDGIEFRGSATHPGAIWREAPEEIHAGPGGQVLKRTYELEVNFGELAKGETQPVINDLLYRNAFKNIEKEWLETHFEYPTGRFTMIILAPDEMRFEQVSGMKTVARGTATATTVQPTIFQDGSVIYWSIENPSTAGDRYAVSWTWSARAK